MRTRHVPALALVAAAAAAVAAQQPPSTFRTAVTVVPVGIRVVDRGGRPITDLKAANVPRNIDDIPLALDEASLSKRPTITMGINVSRERIVVPAPYRPFTGSP